MESDRRNSRRGSVASQSFFRFGDITEKYTIGEVLGTGNYAEVRLGLNKLTGEKVAIKILAQGKEATEDILNEIDILARVDDHPHIIQLKEIYEKKGRMYIVMELVTGGELFDRIIARQHFSENDARDLIHVLIETIRHMHSYGIVHRDLKPENILFQTSAPDAPIKIADFGLAKLYQPSDEGDSLKTLCGTPGYVAPEVLKNRNGYTPQCDMWSVGVILYILLCGYPPFQHEQQNKLFKQILKAEFHFHSPWWDKVSPEAKDMVSQLLVVDPTKRLTPTQAMQHPFMKKTDTGSSVDVEKLDEYVRRIHKRKFRMLKNAIIVSKRLGELGMNPNDPAPPPEDAPSLQDYEDDHKENDPKENDQREHEAAEISEKLRSFDLKDAAKTEVAPEKKSRFAGVKFSVPLKSGRGTTRGVKAQ
jgi:serine/threonine protein kinase